MPFFTGLWTHCTFCTSHVNMQSIFQCKVSLQVNFWLDENADITLVFAPIAQKFCTFSAFVPFPSFVPFSPLHLFTLSFFAPTFAPYVPLCQKYLIVTNCKWCSLTIHHYLYLYHHWGQRLAQRVLVHTLLQIKILWTSSFFRFRKGGGEIGKMWSHGQRSPPPPPHHSPKPLHAEQSGSEYYLPLAASLLSAKSSLMKWWKLWFFFI